VTIKYTHTFPDKTTESNIMS